MGAAVLAFLTSISGGIVQIIGFVLSLFAKQQADTQAAEKSMGDDVAAHMNDGRQSVAEKESIDAQDADLKAQAAAIDAPPPAPAKPEEKKP